jgi:tetratricopeptide (TPR) repeat protein
MVKKKKFNAKSQTGNLVILAVVALAVIVLIFRFVVFSSDPAVSAVRKGVGALESGDFIEAEHQFKKARESDPELTFIGEIEEPGLAYIGLGNLELAREDQVTASRYYQRAYEIDSTLEFESLARFASIEFRYPEALYTNLGNLFWDAEILPLAELAYKRPLKDNPDNTSGLTNLGNIARKRDNVEQAVRYYSRALTADSSLYEARVNLVSMAFTAHDRHPFDFHLDKLIEHHPEKPYTLYFRGQQKRMLQRYDEALEIFERYLELNPQDQSAKLEIAQIHLENKDYKSAQKHLRQLAVRVGAHPKIRELVIQTAEEALDEQDYDFALKMYRDYTEIWPDDPEFAFGEANCLLQLDSLQQAREEFLGLLAEYPEASTVWSNLGLVHVHLDQYEEAKEFFEEAVALDSSAFALFNLGRIHEAQGDSDRAQGYYIAAAIKEPEMFNMKDFLMEVKMSKEQKISEGDTSGITPFRPEDARD